MTVVDAPLDSTPAAPRNGHTAHSATTPLATYAAPTHAFDDADDLVVAGSEEIVAAPGSAKMLRATRFAAVAITAIIGIASFILSFASLADLAVRAGYPANLAPLWPVIVDGTILMATMAILALGPYGQQQRANRRFFWWVLALSAMVSVGSNAMHAIIPADTELSPWLKAAIGVVPPVSLLATAHGAAILSRIRPMTMKTVRAQHASQEAERIEARRRYWLTVARVMQDQNATVKAIADRPTEQIAEVLERTNDKSDSQRAISTATGLHHEAIRKIVGAAPAAQEHVAAANNARNP